MIKLNNKEITSDSDKYATLDPNEDHTIKFKKRWETAQLVTCEKDGFYPVIIGVDPAIPGSDRTVYYKPRTPERKPKLGRIRHE